MSVCHLKGSNLKRILTNTVVALALDHCKCTYKVPTLKINVSATTKTNNDSGGANAPAGLGQEPDPTPLLGRKNEAPTDVSLQTGDVTSSTTLSSVGTFSLADSRYISRVPGDGLAEFFRRPRAIYTLSWSSGMGPVTFKPWTLFYNNTQVNQKMNNYYLIRGILNVLVMISTQPIMTGGQRISYLPFNVGDNPTRCVSIQGTYPPQTFYLNASTSGSFKFVCPFFSDYDWNVVRYADGGGPSTDDMGTICCVPVASLARADALAPGFVDVQFYAWMDDVQLSGPTYVTMSAVEPSEARPTGPISSTATAISKAAGFLTELPVLGVFAKATSIGAGAVASIAKLFGFSRPLSEDTLNSTTIRSFGQMAITAGRDSLYTLASDPKQELTIDPRSVGLPPEEMNAILNLASQESHLTAITWYTSGLADSYLGAATVHPCMIPTADYPTNLAWAALPFRYWTGSLIYRVRVFCSPFMRGRLIIAYDPSAGFASPPAISTRNPSSLLSTNRFCILDISTDTDVEFRVGWAQPTQWGTTNTLMTPVDALPSAGSCNGVLGFFVDAPLQSLAATYATIIVTVRAGEDFMVAGPNLEQLNSYRTYSNVVSVGDLNAGKPTKVCELYESRVDPEAAALAHFGERCISARALAKRYSGIATLTWPLNVVGTGETYRDNFVPVTSSIVLPRNGNLASDTAQFGVLSPLWSWAAWWASFHAGMRGGTRFKITHNIPTTARAQFIVTRSDTTYAGSNLLPSVWLQGGGASVVQNFNPLLKQSGNGCLVVDAHQPGGVEFEVPWHYSRKMVPVHNTSGEYVYPTFNLHFRCDSSYNPDALTMQLFVAAAEDFTPFYFVGAPYCPAATNGGSTAAVDR